MTDMLTMLGMVIFGGISGYMLSELRHLGKLAGLHRTYANIAAQQRKEYEELSKRVNEMFRDQGGPQ